MSNEEKQKPDTPKQASVQNFLHIVKRWGRKQTIEDLKKLHRSGSFDEDNLPIG
mgnify:FL=1|tara:strand:- start:236 stop:397 length:162 start_codon:yes stop_codon:yes gene_type:complete